MGMRYPLDVAFLDADRRRGGHLRLTSAPGLRTRWHRKAAHALELPAGSLEESGTEVGDVLVWCRAPAEAASRRRQHRECHPGDLERAQIRRNVFHSAGPEKLADTGLSADAVRDLLLKVLYVQGSRTGQYLADFLRLPFPLVDEELLTLQHRRFIEVRGTTAPHRGSYLFDLGNEGRERARGGAGGQPVRRTGAGASLPIPPLDPRPIDSAGPRDPGVAAGGIQPPGAEPVDLRDSGPGGQLLEVDLPLWPSRQRKDRDSGGHLQNAGR